MAHLQVQLNCNAKEKQASGQRVFGFSDYDILIDGHEPFGLTEFRLEMNTTDIVTASITFLVEDMDIDAEALLALKATMEAKEEGRA